MATEADAGVDIAFYNRLCSDVVLDDAHDNRLVKALAQLGRNPSNYSIGGSKAVPDTGPYNWRGQLTGETSVMRDAIAHLEHDVKFLFRDLSTRQIGLGDISQFPDL